MMLNARLSGEGPRIVLLHPIGLDHSFWGDVEVSLAQTCCVLSVDLRGHGASSWDGGPVSLEQNADDVAQLLSALDFAPAIVVGLSFGGMIAQTLAIRRPDLVRGLVVSGCADTLPDAARSAMRERGRIALENGMETVIDATMERWFSPGFADIDWLDKVRERLRTDDPEVWAAGWDAISALNTAPMLASLSVPALVIAAENDQAFPVEAVHNVARHIPAARFEVLEGAAHIMHLEKPEPYARLIQNFVNDLDATA